MTDAGGPRRDIHLPARPEVGLRAPLDLELAEGCTTLVGPNGTGKGAVLDAIADVLAGDGVVVRVRAEDGPSQIVAQARAAMSSHRAAEGSAQGSASSSAAGLDDRIAAAVLDEARHVVPDVAEVEVAGDVVRVRDAFGVPLGLADGLRACWALGAARALLESDAPVVAVVIEEPGAFLHPAAQELLRARIRQFAVERQIRVVLSAESPFVVPRGAIDVVVSLGRAAGDAPTVVAVVAGDDPQAGQVGGLFRDPGLGAVLDRAARLGPGTRAVLVVEGGTDEAYLRLAADVLGRAEQLAGLAIIPAGGASAAALQAVVLRAETHLPVLVLLDNDDPGRHARDTLAKRLGFERRREVTTYAEVLPGYPLGTEAEDLFASTFLERFVQESGERAITGKQVLYGETWHFDLTSAAKSAFVAWARANATLTDVAGWGALLDVLAERLAPREDVDASSD